jgi:membrane associated rhomboid family serine protease
MVVFFQRRVPTLVAGLLAVMVTSIVAAIDARGGGGVLYDRLALEPAAVWHGELWRLVTWPVVQGGPLALAFVCLVIYWSGSDLIAAWGSARVARYLAGIVLLAGAGTSLVALVLPSAWWSSHLGGMVLGDALLIAWALQFPERRVSIYLVLVVGGPVLAYGLVALTALFAVFYGIAWVLPELLAGVGALLYMTRPHRPWLRRLRSYRARRNLGVIRGERHGGPYGPN